MSTKVIIFGIDGIDCSNAWPKNKKYAAKIPTINRLRRKGLYSKAKIDARNWSAPNWKGLLTGYPSSTHGVHENMCDKQWRKDTFFKVLKKHDKKLYLGVVYDWKKFGCQIERNVLDFRIKTKSISETVKKSLKIVNKNIPDCMFVYFKDVDEAGHLYGAGSKEYINSLEEVDKAILNITDAIEKKQQKTKDKIYYIVISDHGHRIRSPFGHSTNKYRVPFIVCGPDIKQAEIRTGVRNLQLANVVCHLLYPSPPIFYKGSPFSKLLNPFTSVSKRKSAKRKSPKRKSSKRKSV
tara:strand:+ start:2504 stop:3385 length:882 start_codon:yes stop_codon:yes gene_type:complete